MNSAFFSRVFVLAVLLVVATLGACAEAPVTVPLRSLERSGEVSFLCVDPSTGTGYDINSCPDFADDGISLRLYALVTQTLRGEVAVVDLSGGSVVDVDRTTPGFSFLPVGANPKDIVSTPGGAASFVGVAEVGKEGIYALPTSCVGPPREGQSERQLTSWPACSLPAAPGNMAVLVQPAGAQGNAPASCSGVPRADERAGAERGECAADLTLEQGPAGRRKLAVALPEMGRIAIIDAQSVVDRQPGSFKPCEVEQYFDLSVDLPASSITQEVPPDLVGAEACPAAEVNHGPPPASFFPQPDGFASAEDRLYVADRQAPVVHVIDTSDPCELRELPPLLPVSFDSPGRVVTTSAVAVSPTTSRGQRFVYAVDDRQGSVMIFDVSEGATNRTPLVRPGSPRTPFEPPDRIAFEAPAKDVAFALRDLPIADPDTGVALVGVACDPDPSLPSDALAAQYRPAPDLSSGAAPGKLRGVFGFVMLSSGQVAVVDVDDFDAACRRPVDGNSESEPDFRGCVGPEPDEFRTDGRPTVSGEVSCNVVEPHRTRSGGFLLTSSNLGIRAPSLRSFPRLSSPEGSALPTDDGTEGHKNPILLPVPFERPGGGALAESPVYVGSTLYTTAGDGENVLDIDPTLAKRPSLLLPLEQPRAYAPEEELTVTYEGALFSPRKTGTIALGAELLTDGDGRFCSRGVRDVDLTRQAGAERFGLSGGALDGFVLRHTDYVQVTGDFPDEEQPYWESGFGSTCGGQGAGNSRVACEDFFGLVDAPVETRDFRIVEAYQDRLVIEPRLAQNEEQRQRVLDMLWCCFPNGFSEYTVRAGHQWVVQGSSSGFQHRVTTDGDLRCVQDCNPRWALLEGRVFEVSYEACDVPEEDGDVPECAVGPANHAGPLMTRDFACVEPDQASLPPDHPCVYDGLTARFAIYRGALPSVRDEHFSWTVTGGFFPLFANIASQTSSVLPQSMQFVPQIGQLAIADGAAAGLVLVSLDTVGVSRLYF